MPRTVFFVTFLGLFFAAMNPLAGFAADSVYNIKGVQVDILDESAVKARNKAFIEAQKKAFMMLAARYETPEALATLKPPADDVLSGLIQDFEISSEQLSTKRYRGVFDFHFKQIPVNNYFGHGPVNFDGISSAETEKIMILPYYQQGVDKVIFDKSKNPYWVSLQNEMTTDGKMILPEGSISDTTDIGDSDPFALSATIIRRLIARYEVKEVVVALARVDTKQPQSVVVEIYKMGGGMLQLAKTIQVEPRQVATGTFQAVLEVTEEPVALPTAAPDVDKQEIPQSEINPEPFALGDRRNIPDDVRERMDFAAKSREERQAIMAQRTGVGMAVEQRGSSSHGADGVVGEASIKVFFSSMSEWLSIQKEIYKAEGVGKVRITSLKTNQVDVVVGYKDWLAFQSSLKNIGISLEPQADKTYILKRQASQF